MEETTRTFLDWQRYVTIAGVLEAQTAFRIGAGRDIQAHTPDLPIVRDHQGRPYIPGSSLKGVLRSAVERIARTLAGNNWKKAACLSSGEESDWCVRKPEYKAADDQEWTERLYKDTCYVCRVFGSPWLAGKFRVRDLTVVDDVPPEEAAEIRHGVAIDRETGRAAEKKLYTYEAARPGLALRLEASVDNPTDAELGLVLIGFHLLAQQQLRIGGATSRGLGAFMLREELDCRLFELNSVEAITDWLLGGAQAGQRLDAEARKHYLEAALHDLRELGKEE